MWLVYFQCWTWISINYDDCICFDVHKGWWTRHSCSGFFNQQNKFKSRYHQWKLPLSNSVCHWTRGAIVFDCFIGLNHRLSLRTPMIDWVFLLFLNENREFVVTPNIWASVYLISFHWPHVGSTNLLGNSIILFPALVQRWIWYFRCVSCPWFPVCWQKNKSDFFEMQAARSFLPNQRAAGHVHFCCNPEVFSFRPSPHTGCLSEQHNESPPHPRLLSSL